MKVVTYDIHMILGLNQSHAPLACLWHERILLCWVKAAILLIKYDQILILFAEIIILVGLSHYLFVARRRVVLG